MNCSWSGFFPDLSAQDLVQDYAIVPNDILSKDKKTRPTPGTLQGSSHPIFRVLILYPFYR